MNILYEDNHLLVVEKPVNIPVQADASGDADLLTLLKGYIKEKYHKPGDVYLGLVHRLDRPVGGIMVFARTSKAASRLASQFAGNGAQKRYFALLTGQGRGGTLSDFILRDEATGNSAVVPEGTPNAKSARLSYRAVACRDGLTLADITLFTGRHHQIRVQFAHAGLPLWGDQRYNPMARPGEQIALFAYSLSFEHPTTKEPMTFTLVPKGGPWKAFAQELKGVVCGVDLIYEDEHMLVVNKPAGISVAAADGEEETMESRLNLLCGRVYPVHRLDFFTTGLVMFARTPTAAAALLDALKKRTIRKFYRCVLAGVPEPPQAALTAYCFKDAEQSLLTVLDRPTPGALEIRTAYRVLKRRGETCLAEVELLTGRTHQIRAHMAHIGYPILGDDKYGDRALNKSMKYKAPQLCAVRLEFAFPLESCLFYLNGKVLTIDPPF